MKVCLGVICCVIVAINVCEVNGGINVETNVPITI